MRHDPLYTTPRRGSAQLGASPRLSNSTQHTRLPSCLLMAIAMLLTACGSETGTDAEPTAPAGVTTYNEHVAPILVRSCDRCHTAGGIAPMALDSFAAAKTWGPQMKQAVADRIMPPWLVTSDGSCGEYADSEWLSQADIDTIGKWVDDGLWAGDPAKAPAKPGPRESLGKDALIVQMPVRYKPQNPGGEGNSDALYDDYRCFMVDPKLSEDQFVTATEVIAGNPSIVHHVVVFSVNPDAFPAQAPTFGSNANVIKDLQQKSGGRPGWPCYAGAGKGVLMDSLLAAWAPGSGVNRYPAGTGLRLRKGNVIILQVHYNVAKKDVSDQSTLRLQMSKTVEREAWMALHDPFLFSSLGGKSQSLKPGLKSATTDWSASPKHLNFWIPADKLGDLELLGVFPHMHTLGRTMRMTIERGDGKGEQCVTDLPRWDFDWQRTYYFKQAVPFSETDVLKTVCGYDTSGKTQPVLPGFGTDDEMCLMGLYLTTPKKP